MSENFIDELIDRRAFLARLAAAGISVSALGLLAGCGGSSSSSTSGGTFPGIPGTGDTQVLNYALALEQTEADLYRQALNLAAGKDITTPLPADTSSYTLSAPLGSLSPSNAAIGFLYLQQYSLVEAAHRNFLAGQLGAAAVTPNPKGYTIGLSAGASLQSILSVIRVVEETGVRAYEGAAPYLTSLALTQVAVSIYSTEARHSAALDYILGTGSPQDIGPSAQYGGSHPALTGGFGSQNTFEYYLPPAQVLSTVRSNFFVH